MTKKIIAIAAVLIFTTVHIYAAPVVFFDTIPDGRSSFDTQVSAVSGTQTNDALSGLTSGASSWARTGYTITSTNGANRSVSTTDLASPQPGGIPGGDAINMTADGSVTSGLTFTFDSPINAFGIELEDWATCCHPSSLYISFDGGSPILIGTANTSGDNPGYAEYGFYETFIGSIDDSATFSVVNFYGTGSGDVLYAGGIIRYAIVPVGSISNTYTDTVAQSRTSTLANYLDEYDDSGSLQTVATTLNGYSKSKVETSLRQIFPVDSISGAHAANGSVNIANAIINDRIGTVLGGISTASNFNVSDRCYANNQSADFSGSGWKSAIQALSKTEYDNFSQGEHGLWVQGLYGRSDADQDILTNGYNTERYGVLGGYEFALDEKHLLGFYVNSIFTEVDLADDAGTTEIRSWLFGLYAQKIFGANKLAATVGGGVVQYDSIRHISIGGVSGSPRAEYEGTQLSSTVSWSQLLEHKKIQIEPFAQAGFIHNMTNGYTEQAGGVYNMVVEGNSFSQLNFKTGVSVKKDFEFREKTASLEVRPYINQVVEVDGSDDMNIRFVSGSTQTVLQGRDSNYTEVGSSVEMGYQINDGVALKGTVDYTHSKYEDGFAGFLEANFKW